MNTKRLNTFLSAIKPWAIALIVFLVLRSTGMLSYISVLTNTALLKTGIMNIDTRSNIPVARDFDYDFLLRDLTDQQVDVNTMKGKVLFINLWATWCGPCRAEMPSIQSLYDSVDKDKVAFVMLSLDDPEQQAKVQSYIKDKGFSFPVYQPASALPKNLEEVTSIPTTFVVGIDGKIKMKKTGTANYDTDDFRAFLNELSQPSTK